MKTITQKIRFRETMVKHCETHGACAAEKKYKISRTTIYRWKKRYDRTPESLTDKSHSPKCHPNQHTTEEIKLIQDMRKRNSHAGLVVF